MNIAISGASGKTGFRIAEEAVKKGLKVRQIIRKNSVVGAGSTLTSNVKNKSLSLTRSKQVEIKNYKRK